MLKKKDIVKDIGELIANRFTTTAGGRKRVQCGIVYCLSRGECERVATALSEEFRGRDKPLLLVR